MGEQLLKGVKITKKLASIKIADIVHNLTPAEYNYGFRKTGFLRFKKEVAAPEVTEQEILQAFEEKCCIAAEKEPEDEELEEENEQSEIIMDQDKDPEIQALLAQAEQILKNRAGPSSMQE